MNLASAERRTSLKTIDKKKFTKMIDEYYEHHGWDENGVATKETLKRLGLNKEPSHLV